MRARWLSALVRVAAGLLVALAIGVTLAGLSPPTHSSSSSVYLKSGANDAAVVVQRGIYEQNRVQTYATLAHSSLICEQAVRATDADLSAAELSDEISVQVLPQTVILKFTVEDVDPGRAQRLSQAVADAVIAEASRIEQEGSNNSYPASLVLIESATAPVPASPDLPQIWTLAVLVGLLAGLLLPLRGAAALRKTPAAAAPTVTAGN